MHCAVRALLAAVTLLALAGCPEARPPLDLTQALPIAKTHFDGEWYFQRTVVDTPWASDFTFIGDQGELERIRWRIEQNLLVAVRSYERFAGSDPDRNPDGDYEGEPVAAWPIVSHFDIRRDYNRTTGEETNVIVENDFDRQWFERDYIRVDWSQNLITNWNFYAPNFVEMEPMAYAVTDPASPFAPVIEEGYLDVTSAFFAKPSTAIDPDFPEEGEIPLCWFFYRFDDCTAAEVVVRNSFLRVDERNYEAQLWTGQDMELFGYFDVQRPTYDEQYGPTNTGRIRYQSRWNLWQESHDDRSCSADSDCEDRVGARCDPLVGQCTLPYRERELRTIVWHGSPGLDERFAAVAEEVVGQWNEPMRDTVNALRFYECLDDGGSESECRDLEDSTIAVFEFCPNNPVLEGDPAVCGSPGTAPRLGDLRYNFLYNVPNPGRGNPFGFGPAQLDPLTGEIVSAAALVYEAEIRSYGAWARDLVQLLNGEISEEDFIAGENVSDWISARSEQLNRPSVYSAEEAQRLAAKVELQHRHTLPSLGSGDRSRRGKLQALRAAREVLREQPPAATAHPGLDARLDALIGSPLEQLAITDEALLSSATRPGQPMSEQLLERASPLRQIASKRLRRASQARMQRNAERCAYFREFVDPSLEADAARFAGMDPEQIRWELMLGVYRGTMAHEMGHTLGLRHNLEGSADPFNYGAEYWELRDDGDMAPRYLDPESNAERAAGIREYQYSSVMDYLSRFNSDRLGARSYDKAAIKFGYGRIMEVMTDAELNGWLLNEEYLAHLTGFVQPVLYDVDDTLVGIHYTDYLDYYGDLQARRDVPQRMLSDVNQVSEWWDSPHTYLATEDGEPVVPYRFCSDEFVGSAVKCLYFDEGADLYEIPLDLAQRYEAYYPLNNFARDQMFFNADGHAWRIWDRYFDPMIALNQWWVLEAQYLYSVEEDGDDVDGYLQRYDGYGPFTMGVRESFNLFARTLARPEPGGYERRVDWDGAETWAPLWYSDDLTVGVTNGRYLSTDWDFDQGYFWDDAISRVGFFSNKVLAMEALFDPTTYFLGQDTAADIRGFRVNYGANFLAPLTELVGDLMVGDAPGFAPYELDSQVVFPDYADHPVVLPQGAVHIDPNAGFTIQLYTMLLGLALLPDTYDSNIIDSTRIWLDGAADEIAPELPVVRHVDPVSGLVWEAVSYRNEGGEERGIAARMIERANAMSAYLGEQLPAAGDDDDSAGDDDDSAGSFTAPDDAAEIAERLRLHRENLNLLRAIHVQLGMLDF
ncbi:MAG: hypothetical protein CMP23_10025 [Rickettsiales bacterium]|nr:hypothetical protein [Rickettsiales bacterium]